VYLTPLKLNPNVCVRGNHEHTGDTGATSSSFDSLDAPPVGLVDEFEPCASDEATSLPSCLDLRNQRRIARPENFLVVSCGD